MRRASDQTRDPSHPRLPPARRRARPALAAAVLIGLIGWSGCSKKTDSPPAATAPPGTASASDAAAPAASAAPAPNTAPSAAAPAAPSTSPYATAPLAGGAPAASAPAPATAPAWDLSGGPQLSNPTGPAAPQTLSAQARSPQAASVAAQWPNNYASRSAPAGGNPASPGGPKTVAPNEPLKAAGPAEPDLGHETGAFQRVKVFYATDRAEETAAAAHGLSPHGWFLLTACAASVTILLAAFSYHFAQSRTLVALSAGGLMTTALLGIMTGYARTWPTSTSESPRRFYGNQRGDLVRGWCEVSIPKRHKAGDLEGPSLLHIELTSDPLRHVVLLDAQQQTTDEFYNQVRQRVGQSSRKEAFVFVHGYNVTFDDAARRTAQIAYDLGFEGAPAFFSWPSQGGLFGYTVDETNVVWTVPHLKQFLLELHRSSGADNIHLIAHSMGNRAVTSALKELFEEMKRHCPTFREVVLTAPDIDADVFRRDLAPVIVKTASRVTLYASSNDEALRLSKDVHGYARAGESGAQLVVVPGMDTIDVSSIDTSLIGHSYYGDNPTVLTDLFYLLNKQLPAAQREWLTPMRLGSLMYWVFSSQQARAVSGATTR